MEKVKQCSNCKLEKPLHLFYRDGKSKDAKMSICKECSKDRQSRRTEGGYYNSQNVNTIRDEHPDFVNQVRKDLSENKFIQTRKKK